MQAGPDVLRLLCVADVADLPRPRNGLVRLQHDIHQRIINHGREYPRRLKCHEYKEQ